MSLKLDVIIFIIYKTAVNGRKTKTQGEKYFAQL